MDFPRVQQQIHDVSEKINLCAEPKTQQYIRVALNNDQRWKDILQSFGIVSENEVKLKEFHSKPNQTEDFLQTILNYFKGEFISWMNLPHCQKCDVDMRNDGKRNPNQIEKLLLVNYVEVYVCPNCRLTTEYPRHTDPKQIVQFRKGRCGEYSYLFAAILFAYGLQARLTFDMADHIWNEFLHPIRQEWVHLDSCEAQFDKPLLYEKGWGKQPLYVISVGINCDVNEVTQRYTELSRVHLLARRRQAGVPIVDRRLKQLIIENLRIYLRADFANYQIRTRECISLLLACKARSTENLQGRTSGSKEWVEARGEAGTAKKLDSPVVHALRQMLMSDRWCRVDVDFCVAAAARRKPCLSIRAYEKPNDATPYEIHTYDLHSIYGVVKLEQSFVKHELDWKVVYLARKEGQIQGSFSLVIPNLQYILRDCYLSATTNIALFADAAEVMTNLVYVDCRNDMYEEKCKPLATTESIDGRSERRHIKVQVHLTKGPIELRHEMRGGAGDLAWQYAQIGRGVDKFTINDNGEFENCATCVVSLSIERAECVSL